MASESENPYIVVVANGTFHHNERLRPYLAKADYIIAADGAADWLLEQKVRFHLVVGDMDSISSRALACLEKMGCEIRRYPAEKDETDLELALWAATDYGPGEIMILGAWGGRIDHALANILLLNMPALSGIRTMIYDGISFVTLVRETAYIYGNQGDTLSLIPIGGDAAGISTDGLAYPLRGENLRLGPARGISNVLTADRARVHLEEGLLLVIHTPKDHLVERGGMAHV